MNIWAAGMLVVLSGCVAQAGMEPGPDWEAGDKNNQDSWSFSLEPGEMTEMPIDCTEFWSCDVRFIITLEGDTEHRLTGAVRGFWNGNEDPDIDEVRIHLAQVRLGIHQGTNEVVQPPLTAVSIRGGLPDPWSLDNDVILRGVWDGLGNEHIRLDSDDQPTLILTNTWSQRLDFDVAAQTQ